MKSRRPSESTGRHSDPRYKPYLDMERTYITNDHWYRVQEPWWATPVDITDSATEAEASDG
ncbi:MAG: hypothetical protein OXN16_08035 [Gammaproteobacteria bacterium]|nr:hypothetical protein [Gammaproteobacteria bacterium]